METDNSSLRLLDMYFKFTQGTSYTSQQLADEYNVSTRTITRDIKLINQYTNDKLDYDKSTKIWSLKEDNFNILLSEDEQLTLNILDQACIEQGDEFHKNALKLFDKFKDALHNTIYNHIDSEDIKDIKTELALVEKAIYTNHKINIIYEDKIKIIEPLKLANFDGYWYLIGNDLKKNIIKSFYFKKISKLEVLDEVFLSPDKSIERILRNSINTYFDVTVKPYEIKLFIDKEIAPIFKRKPLSKSQRIIQEYKDGSFEISIIITHDMAIIPKIQQYLPYIKIILDDENAQRIYNSIQTNIQSYTLD